MRIVCMSDTGRSRDINEDSHIHHKLENGWDLLIVADGMGGHNAGEVASCIAVKSISSFIDDRIKGDIDKSTMENILEEAIFAANTDIYQESRKNSEYSGMGTTATVALISQSDVLIGHVGDSSAYILRSGQLKKLTKDHSLVAELVRNGTITEEEARSHPQKNIITRALGTEDSVQVDLEIIHIDDGDKIILCTDGLTNMVCDRDIQEILTGSLDIDNAACRLIDMANELGGFDNITVLIADNTCLDDEVR